MQAADAAGQRAWGMLWHATLRLLWYLGFLVVPAAQFAVGSVAYDAAHGAYWAGLLLQLAGQALLRLRPHVGMVRGQGCVWEPNGTRRPQPWRRQGVCC